MTNKQQKKKKKTFPFIQVSCLSDSERNGMLIWQEVTWALQPGFCPLFGEFWTRLTWLNEDKRTPEWRVEGKGKVRGSQTEPEGKDRAGLRISVIGFLQSSLKRHEGLNTIYFVLSIQSLLPSTQVQVTRYVYVLWNKTKSVFGSLNIVLIFWAKIYSLDQHLLGRKQHSRK